MPASHSTSLTSSGMPARPWTGGSHREQRTGNSLKGMSWSLLKDRSSLKPEAAADLDALIAQLTRVRTARAWLYSTLMPGNTLEIQQNQKE